VDRLIDDVARAMTDANPPADLRATVLARLDRRPSWRLAWLAAPVTVAAVLAMAIALRDRGVTVQPAPASPAVAQALSTPVVDPAPAIIAEPARQRSSSRQRAQTMATIPSLAALPGPRALKPFEIQPDALAIPLLHMKPIPTEPIGIRTIDDGSGGR
jgi:hypothetical protein